MQTSHAHIICIYGFILYMHLIINLRKLTQYKNIYYGISASILSYIFQILLMQPF